MRRVSAGTVRVNGGGCEAATSGALFCWRSTGRLPLSLWANTATLQCPSPSALQTPHRWVSSVAGGGSSGRRDDVSFVQKLKNLYHEFQLSQDRKLDAIAEEEAREGRERFFEDEQRADPRQSSLSCGKHDLTPRSRESPLISRNRNLCPRSVLFVPGSKPRAMEKIPSLNADCFILDLEDSVGVGSKRQARENIRSFVEGLKKTRRQQREAQVSGTVNTILQERVQTAAAPPAADTPVGSGVGTTAQDHNDDDRCDPYPRLIVRINSPDFDPATAMLDMELVGLLGPAIEGIAIPKTTPRTYSLIKDYVHPDHQLWAFFESPKSVIQAPVICKQQVYQYAVMGYNDLSMELQLPMASAPSATDDSSGTSEAVREALHVTAQLPLWQCTLQVLQAARAYHMFVLDAVFNDPTDKAGFRRSLQECKALGLNGKTLIHPSQIEPTNAAYTPSEAEVTWAARIIEATQKAEGGVATVDGKMVEDLHKRQADRVLALHRNVEAESHQRAREAAAKTQAQADTSAQEAGGDDVAGNTREPRRTPSRHRPLN